MPDRTSASLLGPLSARLCFAPGSLGRNWEEVVVVAGIWARNHCHCLQLLEEGIASVAVAEEAVRIAFGLGCRRLRCSSCLRLLHRGLPS